MNEKDLAIGPRIKSWRGHQLCTQILPVDIEQVVSLHGSFLTDPDFENGDELVQDMAVALLDEGVVGRDKQAIAAFLEDRGAAISFSTSGPRIRFSVRCLKRDLWPVVELLAEQLHHPAFPEQEFELLAGRKSASLLRQQSQTSSRASRALSRHLYASGHPHFRATTEETLLELQALDLQRIRQFASGQFTRKALNIVAVGDLDDVDPQQLGTAIAGEWKPCGIPTRSYPERLSGSTANEHVELSDRPNLDVRIGHSLGIRKSDPQYLPLVAGCLVLGGNFSSRLMSIVRDEEGLTYGIRSALTGIDRLYHGSWITSVTLSLDKLERGLESTLEQIRTFVGDGITQTELDDARTTMTGSFEVNLSDTGGLAHTLLSHREQDFADDRIDTWPDMVRRISLEEVNEAIRANLDPERLTIASAGTKSTS